MSQAFDYNDTAAVIAQGDLASAEKRHEDAEKWYSNAYVKLGKKFGWLDPVLLDVLQKLAAAHLNAHCTDYNKKQAIHCLRLALTISERVHGLDSPKLIPVMADLVQFYDYDGAHMLAIEVKQRIDDIVSRQSAV